MVKRTAVMVFIGLMSFGTAGFADEGKDESGKGKQRYEERKDDHGKGESYRGEPRYEGREPSRRRQLLLPSAWLHPHSERSLAASRRVPHLVPRQAGRSSASAVQVRSGARPG